MLDPGIKCEEGYFVYDSGSKIDVWIQTAEGRPFIGVYLVFVQKLSYLVPHPPPEERKKELKNGRNKF